MQREVPALCMELQRLLLNDASDFRLVARVDIDQRTRCFENLPLLSKYPEAFVFILILDAEGLADKRYTIFCFEGIVFLPDA